MKENQNPKEKEKKKEKENKERITVTLDKEIISFLNNLIGDRRYRNRSHAVEYAIEQLKRIENEKKKK